MAKKGKGNGSARGKGKPSAKGAKKGKGGAKLVTAPITALPVPKLPTDPVYDITTHPSQGPVAVVEPFNLQAITKMAPLKVQFEDPDGTPALPPSLTAGVEGEVQWVRIAELDMYKEGVPQLKIHVDGESARSFSGLKAPTNIWGQLLANHLAFVVQQKHRIASDTFLWELIYPQDKTGPKVNDKNRYTVKLFHQGNWVTFTIDDSVPVDAAGVPLLPVSKHANEIWPLILGKALLKLFNGEELANDGTELLHAMCGWVPQAMSLADTTCEEHGFHWFSELRKGVSNDAGVDGTVIAAIAFSSVDKTANIAEAKAAGGDEAGASPPAAADGDEDKRGIVVENPLVNAFMVSPFQIKTQDDDDEDDGLKSGKKSAKSAKGKGPKSGKGDKSAKGKGKQSGRKEADGEEKKDDAKAEPVIDRIDLFDLASEKQDAMKMKYLQGVFDTIWVLYNPTNFVHQHSIDQPWADRKKHHLAAPTIVHVPAQAKEEVAEGEEAKPEVVTFVKLLFSIEAHMPMVVGEGSSGGFSAAVEKYTWDTNESVKIAKLQSFVHRGTLELIVPAGVACVYRVHVDAPCGHYLKLYSSHLSVMESHANMGPLMASCLNLHAEQNCVNYTGQAPNAWFVLARTHITVQEGGWDPNAPPANAKGGKGGKDKSAKGKGGGSTTVVEVNSDFPTPFADEDATFISLHAHLTESPLLPYLSLEWIDHDTLISSRCGLLNTRALKFKPNENGYTLMVSCEAPVEAYGGSLSYTMISSKPLASHTPENNVVTDFAGPAVPDSDYIIFRNVISNGSAHPLQVAARVGLTDPNAGFTIAVYDADDVAGFEEGDPPLRPVLTQSSTGALILPLEVAKESPRFLIEMKLDPLTQGELGSGVGGEEKEEEKEAKEPVQWTLRCVSSAPTLLAMDKTKDNEFQEIKTAWEKAQGGRGKKAKLSRDKFLEAAQKLEEFKKQPIVTDVPELERRMLSEEEKVAVRGHQTKEDERANALLAKVIKIREKEIEDGIATNEQRAKELAEWRAAILEGTQGELDARNAYRTMMLEQEEAIGVLREAMEQPKPTAYDIESNRPASRKGGKGGKGGVGISMSTYVETLTDAITGVSAIPAWKTEKLVTAARECVHATAIGALKEALRVAFEPAPLEEAGNKKKKGGDEGRDPLCLLLPAVEHARSLEGELTTFEVAAWIERSERHMHETYIAAFEPIFNPPDAEEPADTTDPDVIEALQEMLGKVEGLARELSANEANIVNQVKTSISSFNEMSADNDGATPEPKSSKNKKSARKKSAR